MTKILPFVCDPGIHREWHDHEDGTITVHEKEDLTALIERNKAVQNSGLDGYTDTRELQFVGTVPVTVRAEYMKRGIDILHPAYEKELIAYLNNSDFRLFRTGSGHIGKKHRHV